MCRGEDSNLHRFPYQFLRLARLPIPPPRRVTLAYSFYAVLSILYERVQDGAGNRGRCLRAKQSAGDKAYNPPHADHYKKSNYAPKDELPSLLYLLFVTSRGYISDNAPYEYDGGKYHKNRNGAV